ncbi:hypothetical protein ATG66_3903 [Vibrio sp. ES.051]|uniref:DUF883 C-terminal domain-containing protein n=1 Tax=Vibrio sp. ES.051 TaxID=1761909 RepID=UPI000C0094CF|nr:DUF883 C-terminal domain-containing protein [Vibrio sp. ES.051]PFG45607.1 hypothetical protein ATG66_3903 [Vibrio sp. ES.051]
MRSLQKLNRAMQVKRMEGKASLEQCCLSMEMFTFTTKKFVREHPWTTLGVSALVAVIAAKAGRLSRLTSSISSMGFFVNSVSDITASLSYPVAAHAENERAGVGGAELNVGPETAPTDD